MLAASRPKLTPTVNGTPRHAGLRAYADATPAVTYRWLKRCEYQANRRDILLVVATPTATFRAFHAERPEGVSHIRAEARGFWLQRRQISSAPRRQRLNYAL